MPFQVIGLDDSDQKTAICQKLTTRLPDWFGQPEANRVYIDNIQYKMCFAAYSEDAKPVGLIALKPHFAGKP